MKKELTLQDHEGQELIVRKYKTGELSVIVRGYTGSKGVELTVLNKQTLIDFLNTPEPREWIAEVNRSDGRIRGHGGYDYGATEFVKVREVIHEID